MDSLIIGSYGFMAEFLGVAIGIIGLYLFNLTNKRVIGILFGITSGIMIAMICFDILPHALHMKKDGLVILGIGLGLLIAMILQEYVDHLMRNNQSVTSGYMHTGILLVLGVAVHCIPEGFALGVLGEASSESLLRFSGVLAFHSIPEAVAFTMPFKMAGVSFKKMLIVPLILGTIMGIGSMMGYWISGLSTDLVTLMLGSTTGLILYIVCDELLPESRMIWNGRLTSVAIIGGLLIGMVLLGVLF